jgi:hypothetical protein
MSMLWRGSCILVIYTDDTIVTGPNLEEINKCIADIETKFTITANDKVEDFLGVNINVNKMQGTMEFTQPLLIKSIIEDLNLQSTSDLSYPCGGQSSATCAQRQQGT